MKGFWNFRAAAEKAAELDLYGEISDVSWWGDEVTPATFAEELRALGEIETLTININSPGGDVFAGLAIYNILKRCPARKVARVDGLAASSASVIMMAADEIVVPASGTVMIHNAWTCGGGNKEKLRKLADELERIDGQIAAIYAARCGITADAASEMMTEETWMTGTEAVEVGLADRVSEQQAAACADVEFFLKNVYRNAPEGMDEENQHARHAWVEKATVDGLWPQDEAEAAEKCSVEIVYGAPCSGKTSYAREHMGDEDIVYDYDRLIRAMTTKANHDTEKTVAHGTALAIRSVMISKAKMVDNKAKRAYIITHWPSDTLRNAIENMDVTETRMDTSHEECLRRLDADESRVDKEAWREIIDKWFADHGDTTDSGGESGPASDKDGVEKRLYFNELRRKLLEVE